MAASRAAAAAATASAEEYHIAEEDVGRRGLLDARAEGAATVEKMLRFLYVVARFRAKDEPLPNPVATLVKVGRL